MALEKVLLVLTAVIICASSSQFLDQEWNAWKAEYEKTYATEHEELSRREIWEATWHKVQKHNQLADQHLTSYRMGMNDFADMTSEELSRSCFSSNEIPKVYKNRSVPAHARNFNIPKEVDWRTSECVSPVKDQGFCGSCWAFATVGVVESHYCIKNKQLVEFSVQQLVDCDRGNTGCCGGDTRDALQYIAHNGLMKAEDYEYSDKKSKCFYRHDKAIAINMTKHYAVFHEDNMASSVAYNGPIAVILEASDDFQRYKSGIFDGDCGSAVNHIVIIVGYGTDYDEVTKKNIDYWIVRNSWGDKWGESGYVKVKRNSNMCGIATMPASLDLN